jgi:type II secretory pathway component GspD/PulD (secretin)
MKRVMLALLLALGTSSVMADEEPGVTLDVKDEDVRVILKSMQKQCGIRNLVIDKNVEGKGMVYFTDVPCTRAFKVVFMQFGLAGQFDENVVVVEPRPR